MKLYIQIHNYISDYSEIYLFLDSNITYQELWNQIKNTNITNGIFDVISILKNNGAIIINDIPNIGIYTSNKYDYVFELEIYDIIIVAHAHHNGNYDQGIECFRERYITNTLKNEGNCIDDFIRRGINPQLDNIHDLVNKINERLPERQVTVEYHRTGCYERDFTQISLIKKAAEKIVENCNTHLERISEFYTKL